MGEASDHAHAMALLSHVLGQPRCVRGDPGDFRPIVDPDKQEGAPSECASLPLQGAPASAAPAISGSLACEMQCEW